MRNGKKFLLGLAGIALVMGLVLAACELKYEVEPTGFYKSGTGKATITLTDKTYKVEYDGKTADGDCKKTTSGTTSTYEDLPGFGATVKDGKLTVLAVNKGGIIIGWTGSESKKSVDGEENTIDFDDIELIILDDAE